MMNKLLKLLIIALFPLTAFGSNYTSTYRFEIPDAGTRDWWNVYNFTLNSIDTAILGAGGSLSFYNDSALVGKQTKLNLLPGAGVTFSAANNTTSGSIDYTVTATSGGGNVSQSGAVNPGYFALWEATGYINNSSYSTADAANWNTAYSWGNKTYINDTWQADKANYYTKTILDGTFFNTTRNNTDTITAGSTNLFVTGTEKTNWNNTMNATHAHNQTLNTTDNVAFRNITITNGADIYNRTSQAGYANTTLGIGDDDTGFYGKDGYLYTLINGEAEAEWSQRIFVAASRKIRLLWLSPVDYTGIIQFHNGTSYESYIAVNGTPGNETMTLFPGTDLVDYKLVFNGNATDGTITWMEDEAQWKFDSNISIDTGKTLTIGGNWTLPINKGTAGQVIETNGDGTTKWANNATGTVGNPFDQVVNQTSDIKVNSINGSISNFTTYQGLPTSGAYLTNLNANNTTGSTFKSFGFYNITANHDVLLWKTPRAITILNVTTVCTGGTSVTGTLAECNATGQACVDSNTTWVTNAGTQATSGTLTDSAIDAGDWLFWNTSGVVGNPPNFAVTIYYNT